MQAKFVDQRMRFGRLDVAVATARTADDGQLCIGPAECGECANGDVGPLQRLDTPDEQDERNVWVNVDGASGTCLISRPWKRRTLSASPVLA